MRKHIWIMNLAVPAIVAVALSAAPAYAGGASKKERIGVGAGGVIGAIAGGPAGLIVGAAIGAGLGDAFHRQDAEIDELGVALAEADARTAKLEQDIDAVTARLEDVRQASRPEYLELLQAGIALDLGFRTDEHELAADTGERLARLGGLLAETEDIRIRLDGYADERGAEEYNQALSEKRVDHVREKLVRAGVEPARIEASANGESKAIDESADSYALERRVSVTLFIARPSDDASGEPGKGPQTVASAKD